MVIKEWNMEIYLDVEEVELLLKWKEACLPDKIVETEEELLGCLLAEGFKKITADLLDKGIENE